MSKTAINDWRPLHPAAMAETWSPPAPLRLVGLLSDGAMLFENDVYSVTKRIQDDPVFRSGRMIVLGVSSADGTARHDWRDLQWIKNELVGPEVEAFELYPAESRLVDPSNYFLLWCFPNVARIRVGLNVRRVLDPSRAIAPQRAIRPDAASPKSDHS